MVEVGLGGTWDSTNVADGKVAVITPIAVDHAKYLGSTPAEIARDKAGIIKPGATVVTAVQDEDVALVLGERCAEVGATLAREGLEFGVATRVPAVGGQMLTLQGLARRTRRSSCRSTARTRPRTPRSHWPRSRRSSVATTRWTPRSCVRRSRR